MGKKSRRRRGNSNSFRRKSKELDLKQQGLEKKPNIVFGFALKDATQGEDYENWEEYKILSKALSRMQALCSMTVDEAKKQQIIKEYGTEIPEGSKFERPNHIPEDVRWASLRVQGQERVIGYLENNIFQVVFLDKEHDF